MEYERKAIELEGQKLRYYTEKSQDELDKENRDRIVVNMTLSEIITEWSRTMVTILTELTDADSYFDVKDTLLRKSRLFFIGMTFVMISLLIYFFDATI